jgi:hypothetical protein
MRAICQNQAISKKRKIKNDHASGCASVTQVSVRRAVVMTAYIWRMARKPKLTKLLPLHPGSSGNYLPISSWTIRGEADELWEGRRQLGHTISRLQIFPATFPELAVYSVRRITGACFKCLPFSAVCTSGPTSQTLAGCFQWNWTMESRRLHHLLVNLILSVSAKNIRDLSNLCPAVEIVRTETLGSRPWQTKSNTGTKQSHTTFRNSAVVSKPDPLAGKRESSRGVWLRSWRVRGVLARNGVTNSGATL